MTYGDLTASVLGVPGALGRFCRAPAAERRSVMDPWWAVFSFLTAGAGLLLGIEWLREMIGGL